jgi:hypothetical protein
MKSREILTGQCLVKARWRLKKMAQTALLSPSSQKPTATTMQRTPFVVGSLALYGALHQDHYGLESIIDDYFFSKSFVCERVLQYDSFDVRVAYPWFLW